jgi:hypothetical protein
MGVDAEIERTGDAVGRAHLADRLRRGEDVRFVERPSEGGAAVSRGPEGHALSGIRRIGRERVVGGHEPSDVDQDLRRCLLPCELAPRHG